MSESDFVTVIYSDGRQPNAPSVVPTVTGCTNSTVSIRAFGCTPGNYRWYINPTTEIQGEGYSGTYHYPAPGAAGSTTLYVACVSPCAPTSDQSAVVVTVNAGETASATNTTICSGTRATLSATGCSTGYYWYKNQSDLNPAGFSSIYLTEVLTPRLTTALPGQVAVVSNVISHWVACANTSCPSPPRTEVRVTLQPSLAQPTPTVINNSSAVCAGSPVSFTVVGAPPGSSYLWPFPIDNAGGGSTQYSILNSANQLLTGYSSQSVVTTPSPGSAVVQVAVHHPEYCSSPVVLNATLSYKTQQVSTTLVDNRNNLCAGQLVTLTAQALSELTSFQLFEWETDQFIARTTASAPAAFQSYTVTPGRYQVQARATGSGSCSNTQEITIALPTPPPALTLGLSDYSIIAGQAVTFTATLCYLPSMGRGSVRWTQNGTILPPNQVPLTPTRIGTYVYSASCTIGQCTTASYNSVTLTVSPNCPSGVTITGGTQICAGQPVLLTAGGCDNAYKQWSVGLSSETIQVAPTTTTTYSLTCTFNTDGCQTTLTASTTVNVISLTLTPTSATTICEGTSLTLNVAGCPPGGALTWTTGATTASIVVTPPLGIRDYTVLCNYNGRTCRQTLSIQTKPTVLSLIAGNDASCSGNASPATLSLTALSVYGGIVYGLTPIWQGPNVTNGNVANSAGTYIATVSYDGCFYQTGTVVNYTAPTAPAISGSTTALIGGQTVSLTAMGSCDLPVEWYSGSGTLLPQSGSVITVSPTATTSYYAKCRRSPNCVSGSSNTLTIIVNPFSLLASSTLVCASSPVTLSALNCISAVNWTNLSTGQSYGYGNGILQLSSLQIPTQFQAQCGNGAIGTIWVQVRGPISFTPVASCTGNAVPGYINPQVSGTSSSLSAEFLLKRWNGSAYVAGGSWSSNQSVLMNLSEGDYELSVRGVDTNSSLNVCQPPSTTVSVLCSCNFSVAASTTALSTGDEVSFWVSGVPFTSGNSLRVGDESGTFRVIEAIGATSPAELAGNFTWEAWVKPTANLVNNGQAERFVLYPQNNSAAWGASANQYAGLGIAVGQNGIRLAAQTNNYYQFFASYPATINTWTHIAVVGNATQLKLYVNGANVQTVAMPSNGGTPLMLYPSNYLTGHPDEVVGSGTYKGRYLGSVDEVRLWALPRTGAEIAANYKRILDRSELGLRSYWRFESFANNQLRSSAEAADRATLNGNIGIETNGGYKEQSDAPTSSFVWTRRPSPFSPIANLPGQTLTDRPPATGAYVYTAYRLVNGVFTGCASSVTVNVQQVDKIACVCESCLDDQNRQTDNPGLLANPSSSQNYVLESTYLTADAGAATQTVTYADGLGRPIQQVQIGSGGYEQSTNQSQLTDLVTHIEYDVLGRQSQTYLPLAFGTNDGAYRSDLTSAKVNQMYTGIRYANGGAAKVGNAYTSTLFEASPLARVLTQTMPGSGTAQQTAYRFNTAGEVKQFTIVANNQITVATYGANQLYGTVVTDEKGYVTTEFKDKEGRVVYREVAGRKTLYAYDALGQLRCVLPPLAVTALGSLTTFDPYTQGSLKDLVFVYRYDSRGRLIGKKVPGAGEMVMSYDSRDRLVNTTDGLNRTVVTSYDNLDRVVSTSVLNGQMLTQNYYDETTYAGYKAFVTTAEFTGTPKTDNLRGMLTGSKVWLLDESGAAPLLTTTHYDGLGQAFQTVGDTHLGPTEVRTSELDFVGRVLATRVVTAGGVTVDTRTSYDRGSRVKMVCQKVGDPQTTPTGTYWEPVARHSYNAIGELVQKTLGCGIQNVNYSYHMRGWLTGMNNPDNLIGSSGTRVDQNFFGMRLGYDGVGNISTWDYRTGQKQGDYTAPFSLTQNALMQYGFSYDNLSRLTSANLSRSTTGIFSHSVSYDDNGNIQSLSRNLTGVPGVPLTDNLTYSYVANSNRLAKVSDTGAGFFADRDNGTGADYTYDGAGNLTSDYNKAVSSVTYNLQNLPRVVSTTAGAVSYTYTAGGQKLRASFPGNKTYDYVSGLVLEGGKLEFIPTAEGRVLAKDRAVNPADGVKNSYYRYEYHLKDHLQNLRVACRCAELPNALSPSDGLGPVVVQEEHYDPWGLSLPGLSSLTVANASRFKFIDQEEQQGLGWYQFKWRVDDVQIGRFISVDPISEQFKYNSPYAFAENKLGLGIEYEGLELVPWVNVFMAQEPVLVRPVSVPKISPEALGNKFEFPTRVPSSESNPVENVISMEKVTPYRVSDMGSRGGESAGKHFTKRVMDDTWETNATRNNGQNKCEYCGRDIQRYGQSKRGQAPPPDQAQGDHIFPRTPKDGSIPGNNTPSNMKWACRGCNNSKSNSMPNEFQNIFRVLPRDATSTNLPLNPIQLDKNRRRDSKML